MHIRAVCLFILGLLAVALQAAPPAVFRGPDRQSDRSAQDQDRPNPIILVKFSLDGHAQGDPETNRRRVVHFFNEYRKNISNLIKDASTQIISYDGRWPSTAATDVGMWWIVTDTRTAQPVTFDQEKWTWGLMEKDEGWEWD
ncbi:hypothetical protein C8J55DRAFT_563765 [Lentinula edodes]|uniref:Uncharacterized protein n=1 Tax=Lentinula lateritia TaxID=40482 RepID=A0A9W8ZZP5_9AGAR|nr:hypothetical protein C8J55DRAFT_563765 [Lentinula edodes]